MKKKRTYTRPEIAVRPALVLVGMSATMSLRAAREIHAVERIAQTMYERRDEIGERASDTLILFQQYPSHRSFNDLEPYTFTLAWTVARIDVIPTGMVSLAVPGGEFARFTHTGAEYEIDATYRGIYGRTLRGLKRWPLGYDYETWDDYRPMAHRRTMIDIYVALQRRFPTRRSYLSDDAAIWDGYTSDDAEA